MNLTLKLPFRYTIVGYANDCLGDFVVVEILDRGYTNYATYRLGEETPEGRACYYGHYMDHRADAFESLRDRSHAFRT